MAERFTFTYHLDQSEDYVVVADSYEEAVVLASQQGATFAACDECGQPHYKLLKREPVCSHIHTDLAPVSGRVTCRDCGEVLAQNHSPECQCNQCSYPGGRER